jgi:O-antigen ligase
MDDRLSADTIMGWLWGGLLSLYPFFDFALRPAFVAIGATSEVKERATPGSLLAIYALILMALGATSFLNGMRFGFDFRRCSRLGPVLLPLAVLIPASVYGQSDLSAAASVALMVYAFGLALILCATNASNEFFRSLLVAVAVLNMAALCIALTKGVYVSGRLVYRAGPNYLGMMATMVICCGLAWRPWWPKVLAAGLAVLILLLTSSRGAIVAVCAASAVVWMIWLLRSTALRRTWMIVLTIAAVIPPALIAGGPILDHVFKLSDRSRGLGSGATGRMEAWMQTIALILEHPFFGVGHRQHQHLITAASSAHNAYLTVAAELGLMGLTAYLLLVGGATFIAIRRAIVLHSPFYTACAAYMTSFMVSGLVERHALNTGNAYSMVMLLICAWMFRPLSLDASARQVRPAGRASLRRTQPSPA